MVLSVKKTLLLILLLVGVLAFGTSGFIIIASDKWSLLEAFYFTLITLTTIGYSEVHTFSPTERIFTIFLIIFGVGITYYIIAATAELILEGRLNNYIERRKMSNAIAKLKDHYIICGYGRIGSYICEKLEKAKLPFVVIEKKQENILALKEAERRYIEGDATRDKALLDAGINRAEALVIAVGNDADSVFIALSGRDLNPNVYILGRYEEEGTDNKLIKAGADRVLSPHLVSGGLMVELLLKKGVTDLIAHSTLHKLQGLSFEEIKIKETSSLLGKTALELEKFGIMLVASSSNGKITFNPPSSTVLNKSNTFIVLGYLSDINKLKETEYVYKV